MLLSTRIKSDGKIEYMELDSDTYSNLSRKVRSYKVVDKTLYVRKDNGKFVAVWRLARHCKLKGVKAVYRDGNYLNLQRNNILILRNK